MDERDADDALDAVAALGDHLRRKIYSFVAGQDRAVGRDEAAQAVGASRSAAAFHLDRLVTDGLLETEFRRLSGRVGPGAGRPAKLYRRAARDIAVTLPPRRYDIAADLLASAVTEGAHTETPVAEALRRLARERGAALAESVRRRCGPRAARATKARVAVEVLREHGYEARVGEAEIVLANCPFRTLADRHADLVCGMNHALLEAFVEGLPGALAAARLEPSQGNCCVRLDLVPTKRSSR